jgi:pimeloyl-ACP methyl ester carboxylesterase
VSKKRHRVWRWIKRIILIIVLIPFIILLGIRIYGGMKMRKPNQEIFDFLSQHHVKGVMDTLSLRNRNITYLLTSNEKKHKDAIVFVHGSPGSIDAFLEYMADTTLLSMADLITYDRPGFGHSGYGNAITSLTDQTNILSSLIRSFNYERYWLVGHSYGGPIIVQMAMRHPQKIAGMVIIAGSVSPELEPKAGWRKWIDLPLLRQLWPVSLRVSNEELMPLKHDLMMMEDDWDRIHIPVSIIHGTEDVLVPFKNLEYAKEKLTRADTVRTKIFEGESHFIVWSHKNQIVEEIKALMECCK